MTAQEPNTRPSRSKYRRHMRMLIWKAYLQRQRRWRLLILETVFAAFLFIVSVFIAKPVFLTPLQAQPQAPLTSSDIVASLSDQNVLGYAPDVPPYNSVMAIVSQRLGMDMLSASSEDDLNDMLYNRSKITIRKPVIWVIWRPKIRNFWEFSIRSTERARYATSSTVPHSNPHLRSGFLAVQLAVSEAILSYVTPKPLRYELSLVAMPVSPLMQHQRVTVAIDNILLCFVLALLPPVLETEALVVEETLNGFKRSLRVRGVDFSSTYIGWLTYAYLTVAPICVVASITLILIFRWVHLLYTMLIVVAYVSVMTMVALIMALFSRNAWIACMWTTMFTFMQMFMAELIFHHELDTKHVAFTFFLHLIIPPLGLQHGLNEFALLQTGKSDIDASFLLLYTIASWLVIIVMYFGLLMLLQRTLRGVAIGGQVSWKSIIFKKIEDKNKLRHIETLTGSERDKLQEVDELLAKAITVRNVSKTIMDNPIIRNLTLDLYRGEYSILFSEHIQSEMLYTVEDLLIGLTYPDKGYINVLGEELKPGVCVASMIHMLGCCHRSEFLVDELTVEEHLMFFTYICLWNEAPEYVAEYGDIRCQRLLTECDLNAVKHEHIHNLDMYYRAQLCWAIALLLEPRTYRSYLTIIGICFSSICLEYADRVFILDSRVLVFGGTPAYMFFKYGRDYRVRVTLRSDKQNEEVLEEVLEKASEANASVRAFLGSLLILRLPALPTRTAAAFIKYLNDNRGHFGIVSLHVSVPDSEEVCNRAIFESRSSKHAAELQHQLVKTALDNIEKSQQSERSRECCSSITNLKYIAWKFFTFHISYRLYFTITALSSLIAGVSMGLSFARVLVDVETNRATAKVLRGEVITVEALEQKTTLVLRIDNSSEAISIATAYVLSETGARPREVENVHYTALSDRESLTEYLVTRAIDSPQYYVYMFAYGMDVAMKNKTLVIQVLYSPLHKDQGAAARSLARAYMALIRHYTGSFDATIRVVDDPVALDLSLWLEEAGTPPLLVQFLLILTIIHITLLPSKESGLIRHAQSHARNSSPMCYWLALYICDFFLYCLLVMVMTASMVGIMVFVAPSTFSYTDLVVIPLLLTVYGAGSIPQAYVFSLTKQSELNIMIFVIINIVFGETTVIAKLLYGNALNYALHFLTLSPQFNMGYAFVKVKKIFLYNSECIVFQRKNLCSSKTLHKCCPKCGVLQECYKTKFYLARDIGVVMELIAMVSAAVVFMVLLYLWEYKVIQRLWKTVTSKWTLSSVVDCEPETTGAAQEKSDVINKRRELRDDSKVKIDTFGEYLLVYNVSQLTRGNYCLRNIYFGLAKGEALAISGLEDHGRHKLCEVLAACGDGVESLKHMLCECDALSSKRRNLFGLAYPRPEGYRLLQPSHIANYCYKLPSAGKMWCKSRWRLDRHYHSYTRQISLSCQRDGPLPPWMTVYNSLELIAVLRGVPTHRVKSEILNYIDALELRQYINTVIEKMPVNYHTRLNFAAAIVGAPPVIVLDECTAYQKYSVRRAMYYILFQLRKRGHAIIISSSNVESHMPVTNRLAILLEGRIYDIDQVDNLIMRYSDKGYTVVVHLKDEVDVERMFSKHFRHFHINDSSEVLVNVQVYDPDLNWATVFERMEKLQADNTDVYSYIVSAIPIDNIYNSILEEKSGRYILKEKKHLIMKLLLPEKKRITPSDDTLAQLKPFEKRYGVTKLLDLPWSVIFQR